MENPTNKTHKKKTETILVFLSFAALFVSLDCSASPPQQKNCLLKYLSTFFVKYKTLENVIFFWILEIFLLTYFQAVATVFKKSFFIVCVHRDSNTSFITPILFILVHDTQKKTMSLKVEYCCLQ